MKKHRVFPLLSLLCIFGSFGQEPERSPIPVLANAHTTVTIFFPSTIAKVVEPAANYQLEFEKGTSIGLLKARKGGASNLTVITEQGYIYSFALGYSEKIDDYIHILTTNDAVGKTGRDRDPPPSPSLEENGVRAPIGTGPSPVNTTLSSPVALSANETENTADNAPDTEIGLDSLSHKDAGTTDLGTGDGDLYDIDREEYFKIFCKNNYLQRTVFKRSFVQNKKIVVKLNNILVDREEMYFVIQIENNSKKEYKVGDLSLFLKESTGDKKTIMPALYRFNLQAAVDPESVNEVVYVVKRFGLKNKEKVYVVLDELEGNRMVILPLDNKYVNFPTN